MPTKHGQEDLWHLVHGGHGEWVRIVVAPTDVADAFAATVEAFRLANKYRAPAFVALDQQASLFKQAVRPFDMRAAAEAQGKRGPNPAAAGSSAWDKTYDAYGDAGGQPHRVALPGEAGGRYYCNSTEHSPNGFTNEDPRIRLAMVDRRLARLAAIARDARDAVVCEGPASAPLVLLSWGSSVGACREAAARLQEEGVQIRVVALRLLWPVPTEALAAALGDARIVCVEANALAQLARLVRSELPVHGRMESVLQYDGRPVTSDTILAAVAQPRPGGGPRVALPGLGVHA
jgi:2-oxoglutarate ferredoxin oxidoreductase subunit alpha